MGIIKQVQSSKLKVKSFGFTLIETIVVIAVIGLAIPAVFAIIFVILQQQLKVTRLMLVKKEGDLLISTMSNTIRNQTKAIYTNSALESEKCGPGEGRLAYPVVYPSSPDNGTNFYFKDQNQWFNYSLNGDKITSDSASIDPIELTSDKIIVSSFEISCDRRSIYSPATVLIKFTVCYETATGSCVSSRPEDTAAMTYTTRVKLKNY